MINIKFQKRFLFIPFINIIIIFISIFKNSKYMIKNWQIFILLYMFLGTIISSPLLIIAEVMKSYFSFQFINIVVYYIFSIIISYFLLLAQKKFMLKNK